MSGRRLGALKPGTLKRFEPSTHDVKRLIESAKRHSLGTDFLLHGALDSVAATFRVHAFVVDAARLQAAESKEPDHPSA